MKACPTTPYMISGHRSKLKIMLAKGKPTWLWHNLGVLISCGHTSRLRLPQRITQFGNMLILCWNPMRFYREKLKAASRPMHQREVLDSVHYLIMTTYNKKFKLPYHEEPLLLRLTFTFTVPSCLCILAKKNSEASSCIWSQHTLRNKLHRQYVWVIQAIQIAY